MSDEFEPAADGAGRETTGDGATDTADRESPGARLRHVRESHDLTLGQVALSLHVDENLLKSLENDDYTKLGAPIFVKGHLRNYAKMLEMDAAELIRLYEQFHQPVDPALSNRTPDGPRMEQRSSGAWLKWLGTILLLVLLVVLAGWWYYRQEALPAGVAIEPRDPVEVLADRQPDVSMAGSDPAGVDAPETMDSGPGDAGDVQGGNGDISTSGPVDDANVNGAQEDATAATGGQEGESTSPANEASVANDSESVESTARDATGAMAANQPVGELHRIVLEFSGESWVEIYDSNDQPLLYDLKTAGSRHSFEVAGPVRLFLGNAPEVSISVDGERIDVARFTRRDNTARFRIPPGS